MLFCPPGDANNWNTYGEELLKQLRLWLMFLEETFPDFVCSCCCGFPHAFKSRVLFGRPSLLCRCFSAVRKFCARLCHRDSQLKFQNGCAMFCSSRNRHAFHEWSLSGGGGCSAIRPASSSSSLKNKNFCHMCLQGVKSLFI